MQHKTIDRSGSVKLDRGLIAFIFKRGDEDNLLLYKDSKNYKKKNNKAKRKNRTKAF